MQISIRTLNKIVPVMVMGALSLTACKPKPKPPIPLSEMESVLRDMHLAEAYSSIVANDSLSRNMFGKNKDSLAVYYKDILSRHHMTYAQLNQYMEWYQLHPDLLDTAYTHVQKQIDALKATAK